MPPRAPNILSNFPYYPSILLPSLLRSRPMTDNRSFTVLGNAGGNILDSCVKWQFCYCPALLIRCCDSTLCADVLSYILIGGDAWDLLQSRHSGLLYREFMLGEQSCMSACGASFGVTCYRVHSSTPGRFWLPSVRFARRHEYTCQEHSLLCRQTSFLHETINIARGKWNTFCSVTCFCVSHGAFCFNYFVCLT